VGGLVIQANNINPLPTIASNKIEDVYLGLNEQWFSHPKHARPRKVDHLYGSFIYRKSIASYNTQLSPVGHREETLLTHEMRRKGYSIILDPSAVTWHFCSPTGGIRSEVDFNKRRTFFTSDERIFSAKLNEWQVKTTDYSFVVLKNGLGDHFAFKSCLPMYFEKNQGKKHVFFVTFPEVFNDVLDKNVTLASIVDAEIAINDLRPHDVYGFMASNHWDKNLTLAYKKMHQLPDRGSRDIKYGNGDTIIISPYSFHPQHAKSYPYWHDLIPKISQLGYKLVQIGRAGEEPLPNMSDYWWSLPFNELERRVSNCRCWISVDNFLQHLCNCMPMIVPGIVIFGLSDPKVFGYHYNKNILKSTSFLRPRQFEVWPNAQLDANAFDKADIIFSKVIEFLEKK